MFEVAVELARDLGREGGGFVLGAGCVWFGYLYMQERKARERMTERLLTEVVNNSKHMTKVMGDVEASIDRFRAVLEAVRLYIGR